MKNVTDSPSFYSLVNSLFASFNAFLSFVIICILGLLLFPFVSNQFEYFTAINIVLIIFNGVICSLSKTQSNPFNIFLILLFELSIYSALITLEFSRNTFFFLLPIPLFPITAYAFNTYPKRVYKNKSKSLITISTLSIILFIIALIKTAAFTETGIELETGYTLLVVISLVAFSFLLVAVFIFIRKISSVPLEEEREDFSLAFNLFIALTETVEAKDAYTDGHCQRVAKYAYLIGERLGLSSSELSLLKMCGLVHDIGKIGVPDSILKSSAKLSDAERTIINYHPEQGRRILGVIKDIRALSIVAAQHHEWYDGTGYPRHLKGNAINYLARIIAVADSYDAMTSHRNYDDQPKTQERARNELIKMSGTQFDPKIAQIMVDIIDEDTNFDLSYFPPVRTGKKKKNRKNKKSSNAPLPPPIPTTTPAQTTA